MRRLADRTWLPAIAGIPGHFKDSAGQPRHGLIEATVMARPTINGNVTFLNEPVLRLWLPAGSEVEIASVAKLDEFHFDDGSGPWLRDRICTTASQAAEFARASMGNNVQVCGGDVEALLCGSGLVRSATVQRPPADEWELARQGQLHRDCKL